MIGELLLSFYYRQHLQLDIVYPDKAVAFACQFKEFVNVILLSLDDDFHVSVLQVRDRTGQMTLLCIHGCECTESDILDPAGYNCFESFHHLPPAAILRSFSCI